MLSKLLTLSCLASLSAALSPPVPAFFWTGHDSFLKSGLGEVSSSFTTTGVAGLLKYVVGAQSEVPTEFLAMTNTAKMPELVLVFVQPELDTAQVSRFSQAFSTESQGGSFTQLKHYIDTSPASLSLPYVFRASGPSLVHELESVENVYTVSALNAPAFLEGKRWLFTNSRPDIVFVNFASLSQAQDLATKLSEDDKLMGRIVSKADEMTQGDYAALYTASRTPIVTMRKSISEIVQLQTKQDEDGQEQQAAESSNQPLRTTPGALSGLLVMLLLISITLIGILGLAGIRNPDHFEGEGGYLAGDAAAS